MSLHVILAVCGIVLSSFSIVIGTVGLLTLRSSERRNRRYDVPAQPLTRTENWAFRKLMRKGDPK